MLGFDLHARTFPIVNARTGRRSPWSWALSRVPHDFASRRGWAKVLAPPIIDGAGLPGQLT